LEPIQVRKLDRLVLREFAGPFAITFFIALFVLLMQFLWKYVDDLVGKGLDGQVVAELILYTSVTLVPLALPLAVLVSSIMTFGNLAEHFEIVAGKAAGISLQRVMRPLLWAALCISALAFLFSNFVLPVANLKMGSLLYDVRQLKPALFIREGIFYNGIDGYSIRIGKKGDDGRTIRDILIYDHTLAYGNSRVIVAESGVMRQAGSGQFLEVDLQNGRVYEEKTGSRDAGRPFTRTAFGRQRILFDLSNFKLSRTNEELFKDNWQMLNFAQLTAAIDSLEDRYALRAGEMAAAMPGYVHFLADTPVFGRLPEQARPVFEDTAGAAAAGAVEQALASARNARVFVNGNREELDARQRTITRFNIEWHRKFTLSIACFILFLIGAPFGAIVRKGGLGLPIVVSIVFFIIFHVISITGEKFAKENIITPAEGMWVAPLVLLPVGVLLVYKATHDSALFDTDAYLNVFRRLKRRKAA
jgi:lipopolysaccharide export system permease protein